MASEENDRQDEPQPPAEDLDIPELKAEGSKKKKGLLGMIPGQSAGAGKVGLLSMVTGKLPLLLGAGMAVGLAVVVPALKSMKCTTCGAKEDKPKVEAQRMVLPSDQVVDKMRQNSNLDNESLLRAKNAGAGMKFTDEYIAPEQSGDPSGAGKASADAAAGKDAIGDAAKAAAAGSKPVDASKMLAEMQKKGMGSLDGAGGGGSSFGGGGFGNSSFGNKTANYAPDSKFNRPPAGGGQSTAMKAASKRATDTTKLQRAGARMGKGMNQLKLAANLSKQGRQAKINTQAVAYGNAAFDQQGIKGGSDLGGIGSQGLKEGGDGLGGDTPEIPGEEPPKVDKPFDDKKCAKALTENNKKLTTANTELAAIRWNGKAVGSTEVKDNMLSAAPKKCCEVDNFNTAVGTYKTKCAEKNGYTKAINDACDGSTAEDTCDTYETLTKCEWLECNASAIIATLALIASVALLLTTCGVGAAAAGSLLQIIGASVAVLGSGLSTITAWQ